MYRKGTKKIIASALVFMMALSNLSVIGNAVYASNLEAQTKESNNANVEFDAYFVQAEQQTHTQIANIGEENTLYAQVKVKDAGYLKDATITANNANFKMVEALDNKQVVKVQQNTISLNQINSGNTVEIIIPIQMLQENSIAPSEFSKENKIKLAGTYVDGKGKENEIEKEITVKLTWTAVKEAELNIQVSKYVPYTINEQKGVVLQTIVQSYLKDNTLPVKENKIEISVPSINEIKPEQVKVLANTTKATNGDTQPINYTYNEETSLLTIIVTNTENENGNISWERQAKDEFVITYIYPEEVIETLKPEGNKITIQANSELTVQEASEEKVQKAFSGELTLKDKISELVDFSVNTSTTELSKGQIYANTLATKKIETEYKQTLTANVGLAEVTDKLELNMKADNFITSAGKKAEAKDTYFKTISVNKDNFDKILGQEGTINLYVGTTLVAKIDKEVVANEAGNLEVSLAQINTNNLKIETSKPQAEGTITFELTKAIKGDLSYTKTQIKDFNKLELNLTGNAVNGTESFMTQTVAKEIPFIEPTLQAELTIDNSNLSTVVTNEDVKITAILKTDTLNCSLYQNPTLKITLPSYIENINIKNVEALFDTEGSKLTVKDYKIVANEDGTKTILVNLEGTQTEYTLGAVAKGVNVVITSDITVNKLTPNKQDNIKMEYTNNSVLGAEAKETLAPITTVAPTGVITTTTISNYKEGANAITSISGEEKVATIDTMVEARNATFAMAVINNYNNTIENISILGRIPFKANKDIVTGKDLLSTINMPLTSNITVGNVDASKVKVYYSEKEDATKDLQNEANGWTEAPANLANVKSYLIVVTGHTMNTGDVIHFTYNAQIPANLKHNEEAYETYVAYFTNNLETGKVEDKVVSTKLGVTTGVGPILEATAKSNIAENEEILEGKLIKYTITVANKGRGEAQNVVATYEVPNCLSQVVLDDSSTLGYSYISNEEKKVQIENIPVNGKVSTDIWFRVNRLTITDICKDESHYTESEETGKVHNPEITHSYEDYKAQINLSATITADRQIENVTAKSNNNIVKKSFYSTQCMYRTEDTQYAKEGEDVRYILFVKSSNSSEERENTIVKVKLPEELTYKEAKVMKFVMGEGYVAEEAKVNYNSKTRELTIEAGNVDGFYGKQIEITSTVNKFNTNEYEKEISLQATVQGDNTPVETTEVIKGKIARYALEVTQTSSITANSNISAAEDFKYTITLNNPSPIAIRGINVTDYLPKELEYSYSIITNSTGFETTKTNVDENGNPIMTVNVEGNSSIKIDVYVIVKEVAEDTAITNSVKLQHEKLGEINANSISHTIEKFDEIIEEPEEAKKRIVGTVWKDINQNGIMEVEEPKMADVEVMLFNNRTAKLLTDAEGKVLTTKTSKDGTYTFDNILQGNYTVIFKYDTANYSATKYKVEGATEEVNSNAVDTKIVIDGKTELAAITEEIRVTEANIYNINLGLVENPKFDLKLEKTVSKITVQDSTGTKVYDYKDTKLAKRDLVGKQINDTTVVIEYKMKVTNEGAISGYVKKIADYLPKELKFNSELNRDWYTSENGIIYNSSLANTLINPGESKEVTLILTKKLTEDNLGLINNTAEIYEAYNDLGIADVDSTPANKVSNEDDMSSADVLFTVKTGETILFIVLSTIIIAIIGTSAYFIKKKVLI